MYGRRLAILFMMASSFGTIMPTRAIAQMFGSGASPGRGSYRPESVWNDGPYYTATHVNPYLPHQRVDNFLIEADPINAPYTSAPRGHYDAFSPGRGPVFPYAEGFSPYSGFADWYKKTYNFEPTKAQIEQAMRMYFRSGGPRVGAIDPAAAAGAQAEVVRAFPSPAASTRSARGGATSGAARTSTKPRVDAPGAVRGGQAPRTRIYRGG
jgi:hypothetical protein